MINSFGGEASEHGWEDGRNTAPETRARFRYQDECLALEILKRLRAQRTFQVYVENPTDFLLVPTDSAPEFVSVKHREPTHSTSPGWRPSDLKKDRVLEHLYSAWLGADRMASVVFLSNEGLTGDASALQRWKKSKDPSRARVAVKLVVSHVGCNEDDALKFLRSLIIPLKPFPRRNEISDVGVQEAARYLAQDLDTISHAAATAAYGALVYEIAQASTDVPESELRGSGGPYQTNAEDVNQAQNERRRHRHFTSQYLSEMLIDAYENYGQPGVADFPDLISTASPLFTGRAKELTILESHILQVKQHAIQPLVIAGVSGSGKSTLAHELAARQSRNFKVVVLDGSSRGAVLVGLRQLSERAGGGDGSTSISFRVPSVSGLLVVIDGVTDASSIEGIVQAQSVTRVVVTSTVRRLGNTYKHVDLNAWSEGEAITFLRQILTERPPDELRALSQALFCNPLALSQAAAYCSATSLDVPAYLARLDAHPITILSKGQADQYPRTVVAAVELSVELVKERNELSRDLLIALSYFGQAAVPERLLDGRKPLAWVSYFPPRNKVAVALIELARPLIGRWKLVGITREARRIRRDIEVGGGFDNALDVMIAALHADRVPGGIALHPLIKLVVRNQQRDDRPWLEFVVGALIQPPEEGEQVARIPSEILPHGIAIAELVVAGNFTGAAAIGLCAIVCRELTDLGDSREAARFGEWTVRALREPVAWSRATPTYIYQMQMIAAKALLHSGNHELALDLMLQNLHLTAGSADDAYDFTLTHFAQFAAASSDDAACEYALARISSAPVESEQFSEIQVRRMTARALLLNRLNKLDEATAEIKKCIAQIDSSEIEIYPGVKAEAYQTAAKVLRAGSTNGKMVSAFADRSLAIAREQYALGRIEAAQLVLAFQGAADGAIEAGSLAAANKLLTEALQLAVDVCGERHDYYAGLLGVRGRFRLITGAFRDSLTDLELAREILERHGPEPHNQLTSILVHLAQVHAHVGNMAAAKEVIEQACSIDEKRFGPNHPETRFDYEIRSQIRALAQLRNRRR